MKTTHSLLLIGTLSILNALPAHAAVLQCMSYTNSFEWILTAHFMMKDTVITDKIEGQKVIRNVRGQVASGEIKLEVCANGTCLEREPSLAMTIESDPGSFSRTKCMSGCINDKVDTKWSATASNNTNTTSYQLEVDFKQEYPNNSHIGKVLLSEARMGHFIELDFKPEQCSIIMPK